MEEKIKKILKEKVDPVLSQHFGGAVLTKLDGDTAYIKMTGHCAGCPSAQMTLEGVVAELINQELPKLKVKLDTSVSEDLINQAKDILKKK